MGFAVVREQIGETKSAQGRKLSEVPGYAFRLFVTSRTDCQEEILARLQPGWPVWSSGARS